MSLHGAQVRKRDESFPDSAAGSVGYVSARTLKRDMKRDVRFRRFDPVCDALLWILACLLGASA